LKASLKKAGFFHARKEGYSWAETFLSLFRPRIRKSPPKRAEKVFSGNKRYDGTTGYKDE